MPITLYPWVVYIHVLGAFIFMLAHGASFMVVFKLRGERDLERIKALLELSTYSLNLRYASLGVLFLAGIIAGFMGNWCGKLWIWSALGLLIAIMVAMYYLGSAYYNQQVRKSVGLPYFIGSKAQLATDPASPEEIARLLSSSRPVLLTVIGIGGIALILWLMLFKPF